MARQCGTCGACCKVPDIDDPPVAKPAGRWCVHWKRASGCGIYASRPATCRAYVCAWLQGWGTEDERPDRVKVMIDVVPGDAPGRPGVARLFEVSEGALATPYARGKIAAFLAEKQFVSPIHLSGRKILMIPPGGSLDAADRTQLAVQGIEVVQA